jgi:hypothetical protein
MSLTPLGAMIALSRLAAADRRSDRHADCSALVRDHRNELAAPGHRHRRELLADP